MFSKYDIRFMRMALRVAQAAKGCTSPNPAVGAVIAKNNRMISNGATQACGSDHAEITALKKAGRKAKGATLYVTLEPCCHHGRTPPCTDSIIRSGIKRVVYAVSDPNPHVCGKSGGILQKAGIQVQCGLLEEEARQQHQEFFKYITSHKPFVTAKAAQTWDGYIAAPSGHSQWITTKASRTQAHKLRAKNDAILVGIGTVLADDPMLNVRHVKGLSPVRIILDAKRRLPKTSKLARSASEIRTILVCEKAPVKPLPHFEYWVLRHKKGLVSIPALLQKAGKENFTSILVEGGSSVLSSFLQAKAIDKVVLFLGNKLLGGGKPVFKGRNPKTMKDAIALERIACKHFGDDMMLTGYPVYPG